VVLPTQGYTLALQAGLGRSRGDDALPGWFARSHARLTGYAPLGAQWYGQARVELGQVFRKQGVSAPDSQLFRAGGDESVRGYGYRELAPLDAQGNPSGGAVLFTTSPTAIAVGCGVRGRRPRSQLFWRPEASTRCRPGPALAQPRGAAAPGLGLGQRIAPLASALQHRHCVVA
jgi:hypothetical protein